MKALRVASVFAMIPCAAIGAQPAIGANAQPQCRQLTFSGEVGDSRAFFQEIGMGLRFRVERDELFSGWSFNIGPSQPIDDEWDSYVGITPPYRFGNASHISTSYGTLAQDAARPGSRRFWFLASREQAAEAQQALDELIHFLLVDQKRRKQAIAKLDSLWIGEGKIEILRANVRPGLPNALDTSSALEKSDNTDFGDVLGFSFRVAIVLPSAFEPWPSLHTAWVACPKTGAWHEL